MELNAALDKFKAAKRLLRAYTHAQNMLYYDSVTAAPKGCIRGLGDTMEVMSEEEYKITMDDAYIEAVETLYKEKDKLDFIPRREIEEEYESIRKVRCIPKDEYLEFSKLTTQAQHVWHEAKANNDYASFEPYLEKLVDYSRRFAGYIAPEKAAYDYWLNEHENGLSMSVLDEYFGLIKEKLVPLIKRIGEAKQPETRFLDELYPIDKQRELSGYLMNVMSISRDNCAIGETEHPFTLNFNKYDVRITTHYHEHAPASSMYSVIHEGGHALYELHTGDELYGTSLAQGASTAMHESQSRMFENMIGRSREFIELIFPKLKELFPTQLDGVTAEAFYRAVNKCEPSLIRTEADELTYSLHVLIRYEAEKKLFAGEVTTKELPALWNSLYKEYLGVDVPNDTQGVLQDSHWSGGAFGYFPSYSVGSAYSAQIYSHMDKDIGAAALVREGRLSNIVDWLTERIYKYGAAKKPFELLEESCGEKFDPHYYIDYLTDKFTKLYEL